MRSRHYSGIEAKSKSAKAAVPDLRLKLGATVATYLGNVGTQHAQVFVWHAMPTLKGFTKRHIHLDSQGTL